MDSKSDMKMNTILQHGRGQNHNTETQKHTEAALSGHAGLLNLHAHLVRHLFCLAGVLVFCKAPSWSPN